MTTLLKRSHYARHRGVTPASVTRWAYQDRIVFVGNLVDVEATDARLAATLDTTRQRKALPEAAPAGTHAAVTRDPPVPDVGPAAGARRKPGRPSNPDSDSAGVAYTRASAQHRQIQTQRAEMELRQRRGELTETAAVARGNAAAFGMVRDMLDNLPARLASRIAAESDVCKCHDMMETECRTALHTLADTLADLAASQASPKQ